MKAFLWGAALSLVFVCALGCSSGGASSKTDPAPPVQDTSITVTTSLQRGVAPLSVFFDVTGSPRFADGSYVNATCLWDFGEAPADADVKYPTGNGFVAAHVFRKPGTYTVKLRVFDAATGSTPISKEVVIQIDPFVPDPAIPQSGTYCISTSGDDANPGTQDRPFKTVAKAMTRLNKAPLKNHVQLLFKAGETFPVTSTVLFDEVSGYVLIGRYGDPTAPNPVWQSSMPEDFVLRVNQGTGWRITNLHVRGTSRDWKKVGNNEIVSAGIFLNGDGNLWDRVETENVGQGALGVGGHDNTQSECWVHNFNGGGWSSGSDGAAYIGNTEEDNGGMNPQHGLRIQSGSRIYLADNRFHDNGHNFDNVTVRGDTDRVVLWRNSIHGLLSIIPQNRNGSPKEFQHGVLVDSNQFLAQDHANTALALELMGQDITVRNNRFLDYNRAVLVAGGALSGPAARINLLHNTIMGGSTPATSREYLDVAYFDASCSGIRVLNNLFVDNTVEGIAPWWEAWKGYKYHTFCQGSGKALAESDHNRIFGRALDKNTGLDFLFPQSSRTGDPATGTLEGWRLDTGFDQHTVVADPQLLSLDPANADFGKPGDRNLRSGQAVPVFVDARGNPRDAKTPTVGALELP
ncbi:PKD domain-containing protein [Geothrix sp. PMB-07]|uniref:PKD domain-containing protein n=1 Tax=Geothrix sp. PMB-07 TaxID=3068640 RepID=UPI002741EFFA|nr:PKD domain-containing protein [Geothrix sp. PMB-07]WLT30778.1 hypothetical protein Q9293_13740 [Geothrix sp. PMB-07]